jgi:myosin heavy subunit
MNVLKLSEPHFIRCVKPNHDKAADSFQDELVTKQLRYTGMLETTRIRREGCVLPSSLALIYYCSWYLALLSNFSSFVCTICGIDVRALSWVV